MMIRHMNVLILIAFLLVTVAPDRGLAKATHRDQINGREVLLDETGGILSWVSPYPSVAYRYIVELSVEFLLNDVLLEHGYPMYYCRPTYNREYPHEGRDWYSNPVDVLAGFIHSYVQDYYSFTGDDTLKNVVISFADYMITQGSTPVDSGWAWHGCPYQQDFGGVLPPRASDRGGAIIPGHVGKLGRNYIVLYKATGNLGYLDAAIHCADSLADNDRVGTLLESPWPWRVIPDTNQVYESNEFSANVIDPIVLFDELIALGFTGNGRYAASRDGAWAWLYSAEGPVTTGNWSNFFEDTPYYFDNYCQINTGETVRYILTHPEKDPDWQAHALALLTYMEVTFGEIEYGATTMNEQIYWYYQVISHTARYASLCALYYEKTGDITFRDKAFYAFNWTTYMSCPEKERIILAGKLASGGWFTDCHGDFVQHFFEGMAAIPQWAPRNENHMLRTSSVVQDIQYGGTSITYQTFAPQAEDVFRLASKPATVEADGVILPELTTLDAPGWTWESSGIDGICRIRHDTRRHIVITWVQLPATSWLGRLALLLFFSICVGYTRRRRRNS